MKTLRGWFFVGVIILTGSAHSLPAPTEYTMELFRQDLKYAHLVALCEVTGIDTVDTVFQQAQIVRFRVEKCYKGGIDPADSGLVSKRYLNMVGGYGQYCEIGLRSIICFYDGYRDGIHLQVNARGKFDVTETDSVMPPPVGMGFSDEFDYSRMFSSFENLLERTIRGEEYLQLLPVMPGAENDVRFATSIDLSGGATLDNVVMYENADSTRIDLYLSYTPCTGACPDIFYILDTTVAAGRLSAGDWTVYRHKINTLVNAPGGLSVPDDTVRFTVYTNAGMQAHTSGSGAVGGLVRTPNPCAGKVCIFSGVLSEQTAEVVVFNSTGEPVERLVCQGAGPMIWNPGNRMDGVYFVRVTAAGMTHVRKLILRK